MNRSFFRFSIATLFGAAVAISTTGFIAWQGFTPKALLVIKRPTAVPAVRKESVPRTNLNVLKPLLAARGLNTTRLSSSVELTVEKMESDNFFLEFRDVAAISATLNSAVLLGSSGGSVKLFLSPTSAKRHLVVFKMFALDESEIRLSGAGQTTTHLIPDMAAAQLPIIVEPSEGWQNSTYVISATVRKGRVKFQACEISHLE